ncbi:glycosyltransferase [Maribacter sp. ACAM166]|uniref:glycosyltransferase n=1 Tax=Maribacter sp. ACAM166 TaxID=2508996 RepID=UPI0010FE6FF3|nr:glycosyltransferase [Maribacter sp. ACAM166]TLP70592.1 glycosyltransferase [Maribacter sp. ACAM166]
MRKKKWLFILPTDSIQGSEHIVKSLAQFIDIRGGQCSIIILTKKRSMGWAEEEKTMHLTYFPFTSYFLGILYLLPHFIFNFKQYNSIGYTFSSQTLINGSIGFAKKIGLLKKAKVILRESNSIFDLLSGTKLKIYTFFYHLGYRGSSLVICQTNYMKQQLIQALPKLTLKLNLQVIPNPFDFEDIFKKSGDILPELRHKKFLVAAGRLAPAKGFDILIDAFYEISQNHRDMYLVILGEGRDRELLQNKIKQLNLEHKIYMPGYVQNVYSYFKEAKVCVLSSRIEGFPNVLLQMMSQNNNVVATLSAGGINEIPNLKTCETNSVEELRIAINDILTKGTSANRILFDDYLSNRTLSSFNNTIFKNLNIS